MLFETWPILSYIFALGLIVLVIFVGLSRLSKGSPKDQLLLHPPLLMSVWTLGIIGLPGLYSFLDQSVLESLRQLVGIDYTFMVWGMFLVVLGCFCLWIAYLGGLRFFRAGKTVTRLGQREPAPGWLIIFYVASVIIQIIQIRVAGLAYGANNSNWGVFVLMQQWVSYAQDTYLLTLAIVSMKVFRREWHWSPLMALLVIQVSFGLASGFIKPVLWLGIVLMLSAVVARVKLRRLCLPALTMSILAVVAVPIAEDLRAQLDRRDFDPSDLGSVAASTGKAAENTWAGGIDENRRLFVDKLLYRQAQVAHTPGVIIMRTPSSIPHRGIQQFLAIPAYVIPRVIWQDKPNLNLGVWFSINYLNMPESTTSSAATTIFGEGYMFAGWFGTALACLILGLLLAFLYRNTVSAGLLPVFLALTPSFLDVETQFTGMFVALVQKFIVFVLFYWMIVTLSRRTLSSHRCELQNLAGRNLH